MSAYPAQATAADPTAVVGKRVLAYIIDLVILWAISGIVFFLLADSADADFATCSGTCVTVGDKIYGLGGGANAIYYGISWGYSILIFVVLQGLKGMTPGKAIAGIRTVDAEGSAPGIVKALIRWLLLIVDLLPYCIPGLLGLILIITQNNHQRLGDKAAKTYVVGKGDMGRPIPGAGAVGSPYGAPVGAAAPAAGPYAAAPPAAAPGPVGAPPVAEPAPAPAPAAAAPAAAGTEAQWDPARNAYIQWDPNQQQWLQFDDATQQWRPIDQ